jgi:hypothetical protein
MNASYKNIIQQKSLNKVNDTSIQKRMGRFISGSQEAFGIKKPHLAAGRLPKA